jgi:hypothetical protein
MEHPMVHHSARISLNCAIEALLSKEPIENRVSNANRFIADIEQYQVSDEILDQLKGIVEQLTHLKESNTGYQYSPGQLSTEHELALADELLSLYIVASGGSLIF